MTLPVLLTATTGGLLPNLAVALNNMHAAKTLRSSEIAREHLGFEDGMRYSFYASLEAVSKPPQTFEVKLLPRSDLITWGIPNTEIN